MAVRPTAPRIVAERQALSLGSWRVCHLKESHGSSCTGRILCKATIPTTTTLLCWL